MTSTTHLIQYLSDNGADFRVHSHMPAYSAHDMAVATHMPDDQVAKSLLLKAGPSKWLAVLPADYRIDQKLLRDALERHSIHLVPEEELAQLFPDCEIGAMPPLGNLYGVPVIVDADLASHDEIVFNACTHTETIRMKFEDFRRLANPMIAKIGVHHESRHGEPAPL